VSSTDSSACDCRRITITRINVGAAIGCVAALVLFILAAYCAFAASWMLAAGLLQSASVIALGVASKMSGFRWWYVTLGLGVATAAIWLHTYVL